MHLSVIIPCYNEKATIATDRRPRRMRHLLRGGHPTPRERAAIPLPGWDRVIGAMAGPRAPPGRYRPAPGGARAGAARLVGAVHAAASGAFCVSLSGTLFTAGLKNRFRRSSRSE